MKAQTEARAREQARLQHEAAQAKAQAEAAANVRAMQARAQAEAVARAAQMQAAQAAQARAQAEAERAAVRQQQLQVSVLVCLSSLLHKCKQPYTQPWALTGTACNYFHTSHRC